MDDLGLALLRSGGVLLARDAAAAGTTRAALRHAAERERLVRLWPGTYVDARLAGDPRVRRAAALSTAGPTAVLSHGTAAAVLGWDARWGGPAGGRELHVSTVRPARRRSQAGLVVHDLTRLDDEDRTTREGLACTGAERTVVDLARSLRPDDLVALTAWLLQQRRATLERLAGAAERAGGLGARRLQRLLAEWQPGVESLPEHRFALAVRASDLPLPEWNAVVEVVGGGQRRVDALWRAARLGVEIKGRRWHGDDVWEQDLLREADLTGAGLAVLGLPARAVLRELPRTLDTVRTALLARWPADLPFGRAA